MSFSPSFRNRLLVLALGGLAGGCLWPVPWMSLKSPEIEGRVIDAATKEPVEGALVSVHHEPSLRIKTDAKGRFLLRETENVHLGHVHANGKEKPPEAPYRGDEFDVSKPGYRPIHWKASEHMPAGQTNQAGRGYRVVDVPLVRE
jgi:hypothetical protein